MEQNRVRAINQLDAVSGFGSARLTALFDALSAAGMNLESLVDCDRRDLVGRFGFSPDQADEFTHAAQRAQWAAMKTTIDSLSVVTRSDTHWPRNLRSQSGRTAMPWLFVIGDPSMLQWRSIGIGGSRDATLRSMEITRQLAQRLVEREITIVSGGARGVDSMGPQRGDIIGWPHGRCIGPGSWIISSS